MRAKLSFHVFILFVILCCSQIHGFSEFGMYDFKRSEIASPAPSEAPFQHAAKPWTNPPKSTFPKNPSSKHRHHHHHHHHQSHHVHDHHGHDPRQQAGFTRDEPAAGPSNAHPRLPDALHEPTHAPYISPTSYTVDLTPLHSPFARALPSPPPNQDCTAVTCPEPWTSTISGSPCGCVLPVQVKLQLNVSLYTFFPLVSELASEIASSLSLKQSQVRIMGANSAAQQPEKTVAVIYLVPLSEKFNYATTFSAYQKFWRKQVRVNYTLFGTYDVLDVHYPGLPTSPPSLSSNLAAIENHPYPADHKGNSGSFPKPLGVEIPRRQKKGFSGRVAAVITLSCFTVFVTCAAVVWVLIASRRRSARYQAEPSLHTATSSFTKPSDNVLGSRSLSESMSFSSGTLNVTGYAKVYSLHDIEKATNAFDSSRVLGEGGFGIVYRGTFNDGEQVAVKVLKRDNRDGAREFLSEVKMLSRLHHRNLVKLIGICTEEHVRCLVYELVPNGSVQSHLHGVEKETAPLDWPTRMKIALGAARGLAYLHEDSSPCVIHRDFKSSNILLEHDFMPKVSDFGLATNALNGGNQPISTQVIGTFGYLAPEYAMTGHLLVKSDVYSYGVVLLELLTGRKPVDFSNPPGQENLVVWAQPLLTTKEGLELIMDPGLRPTVSYDSFSKVAAIASMCVQPEVSRRPFMGEVVQALNLIYSELDNPNEEDPRSSGSNNNPEKNGKKMSSEFREFLGAPFVFGYESGSDTRMMSLSAVDLVSASRQFEDIENATSRREYSSEPITKRPFWQRFGKFYRGSMRERLWLGSH